MNDKREYLLANQKPPVWIKTTERLPENKQYCWFIDHTNYTRYGIFEDNMFKAHYFKIQRAIGPVKEWELPKSDSLDESKIELTPQQVVEWHPEG